MIQIIIRQCKQTLNTHKGTQSLYCKSQQLDLSPERCHWLQEPTAPDRGALLHWGQQRGVCVSSPWELREAALARRVSCTRSTLALLQQQHFPAIGSPLSPNHWGQDLFQPGLPAAAAPNQRVSLWRKRSLKASHSARTVAPNINSLL